MPIIAYHEADDGSLDDLFEELCIRMEGKNINEFQLATRAHVMNFFDSIVQSAAASASPSWPIRRIVERVIREFKSDLLLQHMIRTT